MDFYKLVIILVLTCVCSRSWADRNCKPPYSPGNIKTNFSESSAPGTKITYICEGYDVFGYKQRICQSNGLWTGTYAICAHTITKDDDHVIIESYKNNYINRTIASLHKCQELKYAIIAIKLSRNFSINGVEVDLSSTEGLGIGVVNHRSKIIIVGTVRTLVLEEPLESDTLHITVNPSSKESHLCLRSLKVFSYTDHLDQGLTQTDEEDEFDIDFRLDIDEMSTTAIDITVTEVQATTELPVISNNSSAHTDDIPEEHGLTPGVLVAIIIGIILILLIIIIVVLVYMKRRRNIVPPASDGNNPKDSIYYVDYKKMQDDLYRQTLNCYDYPVVTMHSTVPAPEQVEYEEGEHTYEVLENPEASVSVDEGDGLVVNELYSQV